MQDAIALSLKILNSYLISKKVAIERTL